MQNKFGGVFEKIKIFKVEPEMPEEPLGDRKFSNHIFSSSNAPFLNLKLYHPIIKGLGIYLCDP